MNTNAFCFEKLNNENRTKLSLLVLEIVTYFTTWEYVWSASLIRVLVSMYFFHWCSKYTSQDNDAVLEGSSMGEYLINSLVSYDVTVAL